MENARRPEKFRPFSFFFVDLLGELSRSERGWEDVVYFRPSDREDLEACVDALESLRADALARGKGARQQ